MSTTTYTVADLASARSGDKGADSNVGVWAINEAAYELLKEQLTVEVVKEHFRALCNGAVTRYELPNLRALNFILSDSLGGGGSASMRSDAQGKVHALAMTLIAIEAPSDLVL